MTFWMTPNWGSWIPAFAGMTVGAAYYGEALAGTKNVSGEAGLANNGAQCAGFNVLTQFPVRKDDRIGPAINNSFINAV